MISTEQINTLLQGGGNVIGSDGAKIGKIGQIFTDDRTGQPEWVTASTGLFGSGESFVPLADAVVDGDDVTVAFTKDVVKDAPHSDDENGHLSVEQEAALYRHYNLQDDSVVDGNTDGADAGVLYDQDDATKTADVEPPVVGTDRHDTASTGTDDAMTRSEERVNVGTRTQAAGTARLRKYIVTEQQTTTVPVSHDEVTVVREPITDANRGDAVSGADLTEEEHEVTLMADEVVVDKDVVPVERIRLATDTVTENREVTEEVRKERIETDTDGR